MRDNMKRLIYQAEELAKDLEREIEEYEGTDRLRDGLEQHDAATRLASLCNKVKERADSIKREAKLQAVNLLEIAELDGAPVTIDGERVNFSKYEFRAARVQQPELFARWAEQEDAEAFFEPEARPRMDVVTALAKELEDSGQELPPGVVMWRETRLSRTVQS